MYLLNRIPQRPLEETENIDTNTESMVSWTAFIRLARMCEQSTDNALFWPPRSGFSEHSQAHGQDGFQPVRSVTGIYLRKRTWDFMPPDVVRPLASITLGDIVVLAQRLGMRWRTLQPTEGNMRAEGQGYALTSHPVRGLGTVLQYSFSRVPGAPVLLVPSTAADKLLCGIIPKCKDLVPHDFEIVGDDRKPSQFAEVLRTLQVNHVAQNRLIDASLQFWWRSPVDDLLSLLCPFMPLVDSPLSRIFNPLPWDRTGYVTPFHFWEGRKALLLGLQEKRENISDTLRRILGFFEHLESYEHDFYCRWEYANMGPPGQWNVNCDLKPVNIQAKTAMINDLRRIFDETTKYFLQLQGCSHTQDGLRDSKREPYSRHSPAQTTESLDKKLSGSQPSVNYMDLVGAHVSTAFDACEKAREYYDIHTQTPADWDKFRDEEGKKAGEKQGPYFYLEMFIIGQYYMHNIPEFVKDVKARVKNDVNAAGLRDDTLEEAWWFLVIRGISWNMAIEMTMPSMDELVPSSFYSSPMTLWIT